MFRDRSSQKIDKDDHKMLQEVPKWSQNDAWGGKNELRAAQRSPKEPKVAKRKLKEASEETQSEFRRTQVGPRAPRYAPREAKMPPESAQMDPKEASGQPLGHQDGPR